MSNEKQIVSIDKGAFEGLLEGHGFYDYIVSAVREMLTKSTVPESSKPVVGTDASCRPTNGPSPQRKIMDKITPLTMERERLEKELAEINSEVRGILFAASIYETDEIKDQAGIEDADSHAAGQGSNKHAEADIHAELDAEIIDLTRWLVVRGGLCGDLVVSGEGVATSRMVSREGNVVTTRSGARYRLSEVAHPYIENGTWPDGGDRWQLIDNQIKSNLEQLAQLGIQKG